MTLLIQIHKNIINLDNIYCGESKLSTALLERAVVLITPFVFLSKKFLVPKKTPFSKTETNFFWQKLKLIFNHISYNDPNKKKKRMFFSLF